MYLDHATPEVPDYRFMRWRIASALEDSISLQASRSDMDSWSDFDILMLRFGTLVDGIPVADLERAVDGLAARATSQDDRDFVRELRADAAAAAGRVQEASEFYATSGRRWRLVEEAIANPQAYDSVALDLWIEIMEEYPLFATCNRGILRAVRGEEELALRLADSTAMLATDSLQFLPCTRLIEAILEGQSARNSQWAALERLDSLVRQGHSGFLQTSGMNLVIARLRELQGDLPAALEATRRRTVMYTFDAMLIPALVREEGRLAALVGDTAGAIRAYNHYLSLRSDPDPGPMKEEVDRVRRHLAELVGERGR
jgi:hypothetical protein